MSEAYQTGKLPRNPSKVHPPKFNGYRSGLFYLRCIAPHCEILCYIYAVHNSHSNQGVKMADIVYGMDNAEYHGHPAVGSSGLKLLERSPAHYWAAYRDPERERKEPSHYMRIGTAYHCAVFEPLEFRERYATGHDANPLTNRAKLLDAVLDGSMAVEALVALPEGLGKTSKEGKALVAEIEADGRVPVAAEDYAFVAEWFPKLQGREVLAPDVMEQVIRMGHASRNHPAMRVILEQPNAAGEVSIFWRDPVSGVECKIRPDYMVPPCAMFPSGIIIDGKSTDDAGAEGFARSSWNAEHYLQAALYSEGYMQLWRTDMPPVFAWLVQEREAPYACAMYSAAPDLVEYGRKKMRPLLSLLAQCEATNTWPGYSTEVRPLALPVWAERAVAEGVAA